MEEVRGFWQPEHCSPQSYVVRPFPLIPTSMVLADPGFACQKPKIPPLGIWCPRSEKLGILKPYSSRVPLSVLHNPQADKWYGGQTQLSWTYAWGKPEMGQGCLAMDNPKPNIWPSTDVHGEE